MKRKVVVYGSILLGAVFAQNATAQVTLTGTNYFQAFDNLAVGLPPGWSMRTNSTATALGTEVVLTTNTTSWGSTSGQFANYASTSNNGTNLLGTESTGIQASCTNRCPAVRLTGTFGDPGAAFVFQIQNTLGLANFQLSVDLNMLSVQTRSNVWIVDYAIGNAPSAFSSVWTNADPGLFGATTRTIPFGAVLDNQSQNVWIRIVTLEPAAGSGSRDTFGIDNFRLNFQSSGALSPIPLQIQLVGTNAVLTWTNASFGLQSAPGVNGVYTNVPGAASPHSQPINQGQKYFRLKAQ